MERRTHEVETTDRLGEALALLDPQSRRLMELWLGGRDRSQILHETRLCEPAATAIFDVACRRLRVLLAR